MTLLPLALAATLAAAPGPQVRAAARDAEPDRPLFQCWLDATILLDGTPGLEGALPGAASTPGEVGYLTTTLPDGSQARVAGLRVPLAAEGSPGGGGHVVEVHVARRTSELDQALARLRLLLILTWLVSSLGCAAILSWVVRRGLGPLGLLRREIRGLDEASLDHRVHLEGAPEELAPVVAQLNDLLARLQKAFERERAFASHAAHELRTPLAGLRSTLELALSRPRTPEAHREAAQGCLEIAMQMQGMVEGLLELSRLTGSTSRPHVRMELAPLLEACRQPYRARAGERRLRWSLSIEPDLLVSGDPDLLRQILHNLIDNAVSYADAASTIEVVARAAPDLELSVSNRTTGAPAHVAELAFDPLWRADPSRSDTGRHAGLGLPLCKKITEFLGGTVTASYAGEAFTVTVRMPAANSPRPATGRER